ncbi:MAG: hypothetical protein M1820_010522 [Bogoriella megaspora]|nr:MAG: hypothetical protein M1820_010522 [Bogoriella megaspora]
MVAGAFVLGRIFLLSTCPISLKDHFFIRGGRVHVKTKQLASNLSSTRILNRRITARLCLEPSSERQWLYHTNVCPIPDYQQSAIEYYFANHNPPYTTLANQTGDVHDILTKPNVTQLQNGSNGIYNRIGRGVPDVAANGDNGAIYVGGGFALEGGTSQATPIFAAIINRIVEERIRAGKGPLGFLNPALYKNPSMFNDITNGTNPGCGPLGFSAVPGWDPVTGLGTANYPKMLDYFLSLP